MPRDAYQCFAELAAGEAAGHYHIDAVERPSSVVIVAPHAGGIEPGTGEIARAVAGEVFSYYCFEGQKPSQNEALHITSTRFDEPRGRKLVAKHDVVLTVHGCDGEKPAVYLGGRDLRLARCVKNALSSAGFAACAATDRDLAGLESTNICNGGATGQGCQLEISYGLRKTLFPTLDRRGRRALLPPFTALVSAIQEGIFAYSGSRR
jgi:phage replication-related protein YjqB (UPF0714/DUF867 family)